MRTIVNYGNAGHPSAQAARIKELETENATLRAELAAAKEIITEGRKLVLLSECAGCEISDGGRYCKAACREGEFLRKAEAFIRPLPEPTDG